MSGDRAAFFEYLDRADLGQLQRVYELMRGGRWWTKAALAQACKGSTHAMSARMSDLRDGGAVILKRYVGGGVYLYRMVR